MFVIPSALNVMDRFRQVHMDELNVSIKLGVIHDRTFYSRRLRNRRYSLHNICTCQLGRCKIYHVNHHFSYEKMNAEGTIFLLQTSILTAYFS